MHTAHDEIRKEKARARQRRYYQRNKEKMRAQARARYAKNSEDPAWREQNAARVMKWQQENPDKVAEKVKRNKLARPAKYQRMALKAHLKCRYNITIEDYEALVKREIWKLL